MSENSFHHIPLFQASKQSKRLNTTYMKHLMHSYSLKGENLLGSTSLVEWVNHLTAGMEGVVAPEESGELVAMSCLSTDVIGSCTAGAASLPVRKACCPGSRNIVWKLGVLLEVLYSSVFLSWLWVSNLKWEGWVLGLIIWQVLLSMESSGNLTQ